MQCSAEEIERKRQQAIEKLKKKSPVKPLEPCPAGNFYNSSRSNGSYNGNKFKTNFNNKLQSDETKKYNSISKFVNKEKSIIAKCVLQTSERFSVELSNFSTPALDVFKTIPSRNYDPTTKHWTFLVKDYDEVVSKLKDLKGHLEIEQLPKFVLNCLRAPVNDLSRKDLTPIEDELRNSLMPFQREGVAFGIDKAGRCLIADDMGLGKTFQALAIASYYRNDWPLLIVTTASMKNTWEETILQYLPSVPIMHLQYMVATKDYINDAKVLIVSHDMLTRAVDRLLERKFGVLIFDESHIFKNFKAKGTQAAIKMGKVAKRVILLSGTPALSRPSELFTQLSLIDSKFFGGFMEYSKRYCDGKTTNFGWDASGQSNLQELEIILALKFMIRRTKQQVLALLPSKTREIVRLDVKLNQFSEEDRKCLTALAEKYNSKKGSEKHAILLTFFSETARIKIPSVLSYILQALEEKKKFLVFAHHQTMLNALDQILKKKNKKFIRIDGHTSTDQRKFFVDKFQQSDECTCALLSTTAAYAGITLTAAQLVIFAELHWNPSILAQAESRAHRIGQENPVTIRYLLAPGTADDSIWPMLQKKQTILNDAGLSKDTFDNVEVKSHSTSREVKLTEGISYKTTRNTLDISSYFESPSKKQKINDSVVSDLNESLFEDSFNVSKTFELENVMKQVENETSALNSGGSEVNVQDMLNDGFDDILGNIDF